MESEKNIAAIPMFSGELSFMGCPWTYQSSGILSDSVIVLGVPFDSATSNRPGARFGPRAIRVASKMLSWQKLYPWEDDCFNTSRKGLDRIFDGGDVDFDFGRTQSITTEIEKSVKQVISSGAKPLLLGGDHSLSYPSLQALNDKEKNTALALVHFDAHYDMWNDEPGRIDHGTGFYHAVKKGVVSVEHSIQIGLRTHKEQDWGIASLDSFEMNTMMDEDIVNRIKKQVKDFPAYLSFDIDVLDPAFAPGTGTPVCGGLTPIRVLNILRQLSSVNWVGGDVVEVSPPYDHAEVTALAGATVAGYLGYLLLNKKN